MVVYRYMALHFNEQCGIIAAFCVSWQGYLQLVQERTFCLTESGISSKMPENKNLLVDLDQIWGIVF